MKQPMHPPLKDLQLLRALSALSDPIRLHIMATLADGRERGWGEFDVVIGKSTLSHHMKTLREAGLITTRLEGTRCFVSLREEFSEKFPGLVDTVLSLTEPSPPLRSTEDD